MFRKESGAHKILASVIVILLSPIVFVGVPVRLAFNDWFIEWEYSKVDFPKDRYGMEDEYRKKLAKIGLRSVLSNEGMEEFKRAKLPDGRPAFREKEIKHMEDVKNFLDVFFPLVYVSVVVSGVLLFFIGDLRRIGLTLMLSSVFSLLLVVSIALFSFFNYELAFEIFHNYVFDPYSWRFKYTDTLLRIYPMKLWYDGTMFVITLAGMLSFLSLVTGLAMLKYRR